VEARSTPCGDYGVGLYTYTTLPSPILLCGVYCNNAGSGENIMLRSSVNDDGVGWGA